MKKIYGILSGVCAMIVFYATVAFFAIYFIFGAVANQTSEKFGMFDNWWQVLIFIIDILAIIGFIVTFIFYLKNRKLNLEDEEDD